MAQKLSYVKLEQGGDMYFKRLLELRAQSKKTQKEIAKMVNCAVISYRRYEKGERTIPPSMLLILSDFYKVSVDYIVGETDSKERYKS